jgi:hypothetical protein
MRPPDFDTLAQELRAVGAAPSVITRIIEELGDHCADAEAVALEGGLAREQARRAALNSLGSIVEIVAAVAERSELLDWRHRWPHSARYVDRLTCCLVAPAAPFVYCAMHPAWLLRWGLSSGLAACVTASMLLGLNWLIA